MMLRRLQGATGGRSILPPTAPADGGAAGGAAEIDRGGAHVARAELVLAQSDRYPLREVPLNPDPLTGLARAFADIREDLGESAEVAVDLLPLNAAERRHRRGHAVAETGGGSSWARHWGAARPGLVGAGGHRPATRTAQRVPERRLESREQRSRENLVARKVLGYDPEFYLQVLIRVRSDIEERPAAHLHALIAGFDVWAGENYLKVAGVNLMGFVHLGSDRWWRRRSFDRRMDSGLFAPKKRAVVTGAEIAGLLKPPTARCPATNVVRSGGVIPPPPRDLPTYTGQPDLIPQGIVSDEDGERVFGVRMEDTYFSFRSGRSRFGKTEGAVTAFVATARAGHGCMFLDPHADALARMKPYLADLGDRVIEINLAPRGRAAAQAGWNLFAMEGRTSEDVEARVSAVVDSFASALQWGEVNNRALTLTTMAAQSLCELALAVPAEMAPTLFQMTTILSNEEWRQTVLPCLSPASRAFWVDRFPKLSADAITPVTNLIDRLRSSATVAALFGASRSTYDIRAAMDTGKVVLACPAGTGDKDKLIANFFIYDLLQAALSRKDLEPDRRRPFHVYVDEMQSIDGAAKGNLAALLEQCGKYGIRLHAMAQQPTRLTKTTLEALLTNRSHLLSTVVGSTSAKLLAKEWSDKVAPTTVTQLPKYHFIGSFTVNGQVSDPFRFRGVTLPELFGHVADPDGVPALDEAIDEHLGRRPVGAVLAELDTLDRRIAHHLAKTPRSGIGVPDAAGDGDKPPPPPSGRGSGRGLRIVGR